MRWKVARLAVAAVALVPLAACQYGMRRDVLRQQAAEDLGCPAADVTVTHGSEGYRASGCGQDAQYDCPEGPDDMTTYGDRSCTIVRRTVGLEELDGSAETAGAETAGAETAGQATGASGVAEAQDGDADASGEGADGADDSGEAAGQPEAAEGSDAETAETAEPDADADADAEDGAATEADDSPEGEQGDQDAGGEAPEE